MMIGQVRVWIFLDDGCRSVLLGWRLYITDHCFKLWTHVGQCLCAVRMLGI